MRQKILAIMMVGLLVGSVGVVSAKSIKCTVKAVDGETVTLECKGSEALVEGMKVKVKTSSKKAIEGC